jgi:hypothetical protein
LSKAKLRLQDGRPNLFNLVRLRVRANSLQIDLFLHAAFPENVMAAPHALLETQALQNAILHGVFNGRPPAVAWPRNARTGFFRLSSTSGTRKS